MSEGRTLAIFVCVMMILLGILCYIIGFDRGYDEGAVNHHDYVPWLDRLSHDNVD